MTMKRGPTSRWKSEQVIIAVIGGVVAIVVAVLGLIGVLGGDDQGPAGGTSPSILKSGGTPQILISTTTFEARSDGSVEIGVIGTVLNFGPDDRLYAVAQPPAKTSWWVSHEVSPTLGGDWVAQIVATAQAGQQLKVFAVLILSESYEPPDATTEPTTSSPTGEPTSPTGEPTPSSVPSRGSAREIEAALRARGPDARWVSGRSSQLTVAVPTQ